jgi:subtilase family serine protease
MKQLTLAAVGFERYAMASGDQASFCVPTDSPYFDGNAHASFAASSPYALACGGTHIISPDLGRPVEEVWHPAYGVGTGGGISRYFPVPDYQRGVVTQNAVLIGLSKPRSRWPQVDDSLRLKKRRTAQG